MFCLLLGMDVVRQLWSIYDVFELLLGVGMIEQLLLPVLMLWGGWCLIWIFLM